MLRVSRHENIFILFFMAIKTAGSAQKVRVSRVSGNTAIFCLRLRKSLLKDHHYFFNISFSRCVDELFDG